MPTQSRHVKVKMQCVDKMRNHGYGFFQTEPDGIMSAEQDQKRVKGSGVRVAYETLRDEILTLALAPGALLDETTLADRFGMSRSPVREALIRLAGDDLVVTLSNRSTMVAPIDVQSFPKYVEALDIAQRMNTRLAAELRSKSDLQAIAQRQKEFVTAVKAGNHLAMSEANMAFHMAIAAAGGNPFLTSFYERLLRQGRRMLHLHFDFIEKGHGGYLLTDEHDEMLDAIEQQDADRADRLAHAHTRQFRDNFVDFMKASYLSSVQVATQNEVVGRP
jgi:DNA-binding GntR family transcriptional regulator